MPINKYPLSAANGRAIPNEAKGPVSYNAQTFTTSALGTLVQDAGYKDHLIWIYATEAIILRFSEDATLDAGDTEEIYLTASEWHLIAPPKEYYDVKGATAGGTAHINTVVRWDTLGTEVQTDFG